MGERESERERPASRQGEAGRRGTETEGSRRCDADEWFAVVCQGQTIATITNNSEGTDGRTLKAGTGTSKSKDETKRTGQGHISYTYTYTQRMDRERERERVTRKQERKQGQRWFLGRAKETNIGCGCSRGKE